MLLPHDGNPHNSKCMVAHPGKVYYTLLHSIFFSTGCEFSTQVAEMTCSFDGKYVFTAGGEDCAVNMWNINTELVCIVFMTYASQCLDI